MRYALTESDPTDPRPCQGTIQLYPSPTSSAVQLCVSSLLALAAMARRHPSLLWSPHESDVFAIGTSDNLKVYRFAGDADLEVNERKMQLVGGITDVQQLKCVAWCPHAAQPWMFAVGTSSGRLVLHDCSLGAGAGSRPTSALCEFLPRFQRVCFSVAWNPAQPQQIAAGLDKVRSAFGVLVWDVTRANGGHGSCDAGSNGSGTGGGGIAAGSVHASCMARDGEIGGANGFVLANPSTPTVFGAACGSRRGDDFSSCMSFDLSAMNAVPTVEKPVATLGNSEAATSIGWVGGSPSCLLVGTGFRWLRMYDLRARESVVGSPVLSCYAHAKAVYGVCFDPFQDNRFVTHSDDADGLIKGWDVRSLRDNAPLFTIATTGKGAPHDSPAVASGRSGGSGARGVVHVGWSPTRRGLLSTAVEGSPTIALWDVDHAVARYLEEDEKSSAPDGSAGAIGSMPSGRQAGGNAASAIKGGGTPVAGARLTVCETAYDCETLASAAAWHPTDQSRRALALEPPLMSSPRLRQPLRSGSPCNAHQARIQPLCFLRSARTPWLRSRCLLA